jgi:hypothetical protein
VGLTATVTGISAGDAIITVRTADGRFIQTATVTVIAAVAVLPFAEDFTGILEYSIPLGWTETYSTTPTNGLIYVYDGNGAGGISPELWMEYWPSQGVNVTYRVSTKAIDTSTAASTLSLSFKHRHYYYGTEYPFQIAVDVSTDGGTSWTPIWSVDPTSEIGPATVNVDLSSYKGQTIKISWRMSGYTYNSNGWAIDDINVTGN